MTISSEIRTAGPVTGNGVATGLPFYFKVFLPTEIVVVQTDLDDVDTTLVYGTDYSVTLNADQNTSPGGTITYLISGIGPSLIPTGYVLNATSDVQELQPVALTNLGGFFPQVLNGALDRVTILIQQISSKVLRSLQFPISVDLSGFSTEVPAPVANYVLGAKSDNSGFEWKVAISTGSTIVSAFMANFLTLSTAALARANLGAAALAGGNSISGTQAISGIVNMTNAINENGEVQIAVNSASMAIGAAASNNIEGTGGGTLTGFDTGVAGMKRMIRFSSTSSITASASLKLIGVPSGSSRRNVSGDRSEFYCEGAGVWQEIRHIYANARPDILPAFGDCRLDLTSSTVVTLSPFRGNRLTFPTATAQQGSIETIPSAGVAATISNCYKEGVAGQTLTASTLYYVYAFMNAGTMTLDFSTTGHTADTTNGIQIKTGDATRVLVGKVYVSSGVNFVDSGATRTVLSWFNQKPKVAKANFTADRTTTSTSYTELNTEIRNVFITWADQMVNCSASGSANNSTAAICGTAISIDGGTPEQGAQTIYNVNNATTPYGFAPSAPVEGLSGTAVHYATLFGKVASGTGTWLGAAATPDKSTLSTIIMG